MVEPKIKKWSYFTAFVLPCFVLYIIFFIVPFFRGIAISFTNWDGLTPKTPIVLEKSEFESKILDNIKKSKDKDFVLGIYSYRESDNSYQRIAVKGKEKYRLERIFRKAGYEPERYKFVGLENYKKIFTGQVGANFYPHKMKIQKFTKTSALPNFISKKEFEGEIKRNLKKNPEFTNTILGAYTYNSENERYVLEKQYNDFIITEQLWELPEITAERKISDSEIDKYIRDVKALSLDEELDSLNDFARDFFAAHEVSEVSKSVFYSVNEKLLDSARVKDVLSEVWVVNQNYMGVIGFTLFFAIFSVIGINVVAFALALALDTGIRGQKILRTIYFLPNVLSMIIVALIWSMLFVQFLPAVTGIEKWISDSQKTPWLLVLVAVWQGAGYYMIVYLAGLQNISTDVIEAAKIDGATGFQRFRYVTLPLMIPSLTISLFLTIANALKSFDLIYAMIGQTGYATGTVPFVMDIYFDAFSLKQAGLATAKAMILFFVIVIVTGIQLVTMKRKEIEA